MTDSFYCFIDAQDITPIPSSGHRSHPKEIGDKAKEHLPERESSHTQKRTVIMRTRDHWIPDSHCQECFECGRRFTTLVRRHHCRFCGRIFCHRCSNHLRDGSSIGCVGPQRACGFCASHHELSTAPSLILMRVPEDSGNQACLDQPINIQSPFDEGEPVSPDSQQLFPCAYSNSPYPHDGSFQTWHPRCNNTRAQVANLLPSVDDNQPFPQQHTSSFSMGGTDSLPDMQTIFCLWFKMTCSQLIQQRPEESRFAGLSFFTKNRYSGVNEAKTPLWNQGARGLEYVMVGSERCASGQKIVDWLISPSGGNLESREKARALCNYYLKASLIKPLEASSRSEAFVDGCQIYKIRENDVHKPVQKNLPKMSVLFRNASRFSSSQDRGEGRGSSIHVASTASSPLGTTSIRSTPAKPELYTQTLPLENTIDLRNAYKTYLQKLISQETRDHYLSIDWNAIVLAAVNMLCKDIKLDLRRVLVGSAQQRVDGGSSGAVSAFKASHQSSLTENAMLQEFCPSKYSSMSILRYVHFKKVIDEKPACQILNGVAFTGNLVDKHLPTQLYQPRILVFAASITYERNFYKMTWLQSYAAQEEEYLVNCVAKILSFRPTVLLTEGVIANKALRMLIKSGIAIFCNVKRSVLARLAAATGAEVISSTDAFLSGSYDVSEKHPVSPVGTCRWYRMITVSQSCGTRKPVCIFSSNDLADVSSSGIAQVDWFHIPGLNLGYVGDHEGRGVGDSDASKRALCSPSYSVILRGPDLAVLKLVQRCCKLALLSCFNAQLEAAYLEDAQIRLTADPNDPKMSLGCASLDTSDSSLARHLSGRLFNLSPLALTEFPFLASSQGRRAPLFDFYFYLVDWSDKRLLNDTLKQKAIIMRARLYATSKALSKYSLPAIVAPTGASSATPTRGSSEEPWKSGLVRRWTGMGRIISSGGVKSDSSTAGNTGVATKPRSLKQTGRIASTTGNVNKRLTRSIRDARSQGVMHVLRSVFSPASLVCPDPCLPPWIIGIDFYGPSDLPLGAFLEHFCFRMQNCLHPDCNTSMLEHIQRFTQTTGSVKLSLAQIDSVGSPVSIMLWTHCHACKQNSPLRPMSPMAWHFSFMKFIDLLINSPPCLSSHDCPFVGVKTSTTRNLVHCFSLDRIKATFSCQPTILYEVCMPPISVWTFHPSSDPSLAASYAKVVVGKIAKSAAKKTPPSNHFPLSSGALAEPSEMPEFLILDVHNTLKKFHEITMAVKSHLISLSNATQCEDLTRLLEAFEGNLQLECAEVGVRSRVEVLSFLFNSLSKLHATKEARPDDSPTESEEAGDNDRTLTLNATEPKAPWMFTLLALSYEERIVLISTLMYIIKRWLFNFANDWNTRFSQFNATMKMLEKAQSKQTCKPPQPLASRESGTIVTDQTCNGNELSPSPPDLDLNVFDTEMSETASVSQKLDSDDVSHSLSTAETKSVAAASSTVEAMRRMWTAILPGGGEQKVCLEPWPPSEHPQIAPPQPHSALLAALAIPPPTPAALAEAEGASRSQVDANALLVEKLRVVPLLEVISDVYICDQEITSIIAYALATEDYASKLQSLATPHVVKAPKRSTDRQGTEMTEKRSSSSTSSLQGSDSVSTGVVVGANAGSGSSADPKSSKASATACTPTDAHIEVVFSDANSTFLCRAYYAEEFHQLRKLLMPQGEAAFIRSLSRCRDWDARGGKSGSCFMKTNDERFVVKEVSSTELRTFHDIKKQYFDYLISAASVQRLSLLARIFGIYHIDSKNTLTGDARRLDVLVMENLFHNRPGVTHIYDLKGSLRGRLMTPETPSAVVEAGMSISRSLTASNASTTTSLEGDSAGTETGARVAWDSTADKYVPVLLDQNFINESLENPIYLRLHSKNALMHCLSNDSQFLADLFIMDYSLLVGVEATAHGGDEGHRQLVVGIIDYLRKFTLNKRLEMFVKQTLTSVQGPMPTIIMPADYRERLLDQMDRNFHLVPDQWYDSLADHREAWKT